MVTTLWRPLIYKSCTGFDVIVRQMVGYREERTTCYTQPQLAAYWQQIGGQIPQHPLYPQLSVWNPPVNGVPGAEMPWPPFPLAYNCHNVTFMEGPSGPGLPVPPLPPTSIPPLPGDPNPAPFDPMPPGQGLHIDGILPLISCCTVYPCDSLFPSPDVVVWWEVPLKKGGEPDHGEARPIHSARRNGDGSCRSKNGFGGDYAGFPEDQLDTKYGADGEVRGNNKIMKHCMVCDC